MADLNVRFIHPIDGRTVPVLLNDDMTASEVVEELVRKNVLTSDSQSNNLVKKDGTSIQPNQTFQDAGIKENDIIRINLSKNENKIFKIRVHNQTPVTLLLGSGASAPSGIGTVSSLLAQLQREASKMGLDDLDRLFELCQRRNITNIEDLLNASYIASFAVTRKNVLSVLDELVFAQGGELSESARPSRPRREDIDESALNSFQGAFQILFGLLASAMIAAQPNDAHYAIVDFIKHHKNTSIVTTNYDICMEEALSSAVKSDERSQVKNVIKIHGSINWWCCDYCPHIHKTDALDLKKEYGSGKLIYAIIGHCKKCGGLMRPLLVPPYAFKSEKFLKLGDNWNSAKLAFDNAHYLIVVGYSFSKSDNYILQMILDSMHTNENQKILIIDTNPEVAEILRKEFSKYISNFDKTRVLDTCGDCKEILPKILQSLLFKKLI